MWWASGWSGGSKGLWSVGRSGGVVGMAVWGHISNCHSKDLLPRL